MEHLAGLPKNLACGTVCVDLPLSGLPTQVEKVQPCDQHLCDLILFDKIYTKLFAYLFENVYCTNFVPIFFKFIYLFLKFILDILQVKICIGTVCLLACFFLLPCSK